jgi:AsmA protein
VQSRVLKSTAVALAAVLALLLVCGVLLRLLFDPGDYRTTIERVFNERTGRALKLEGELGLRLLPRLAVSTGPFSISDRPGFGDEPFLTARDARLGLALLPLLRRRIELGELVLMQPVVALRIDADGRDNWSDLLDQATPPELLDGTDPEPIAAPEDAVDLAIAGLRVVDGQLSFDDARSKRRLRFAQLEARTGPLDFETPRPVRLGFALLAADAVRLRATVNGRVANVRPRVWTVEDFVTELTLPGAGSGREAVRGRIEAARLRADLDARQYAAPELRYALGDAKGEASLDARPGEDGMNVQGPVTLEIADLRRLMTDLGVALPAFRDSKAPGAFALEATLQHGKALALRDIVAVLGDTRFTGSVEFGTAAAAPIRFDLQGNRLDLDRYLPPAQRDQSAPDAAPPSPQAGRSRVRALDIQGRFSFGRVTLAKLDLRDLDGSLAMKNGQLRVDPLRASLFGGTSLTQLRYDLAAATPQLALEQRLADVDVASMLGRLANQHRLTGRGSLTAQLTGSGDTRKALVASLAGPFEARVVAGRFEGVDLWAEIERAVAAARGTATPRGTGIAYTPFDLFQAKGRVDGTRIRNDRFDVVNAQLRAHGQGTVDYGTGALDLDLTARLLEAPEGAVAGLSLDRIVGVDIPLTVRGTISAPRVRPDVKRLLESAAKQQLRQEGEKVEKKLKDKLNETLKDLLGQ